MDIERDPKDLLNPRQQRFCREYVKDLNATRSYKKVYGCAYSTANVEGSKSLANPSIKAYVNQLLEEREKRTNITADRVLEELAKIGFANVGDVVRIESDDPVEEGNPRRNQRVTIHDTEDLSENELAAISEIKNTRDGITIKMHDKTKALENLARHLGMFNDKLTVTGDINTNNINAFKDMSPEEIKEYIKSLSKQ
ncbi:terminase small subunit [Clostridium sp. LP20]|uniref:terminase small subunit n=1 Tax=Clostridium sp. LP20 TaxID=3418665 RepID=UPI003EE51B3B